MVIRIATVNVGGWSAAKGLGLRRIMDARKLDLLVLTGTCAPLSTMLPGCGSPFFVKGRASYSSGVALVYPARARLRILHMSERLVHCVFHEQIHVVGVYNFPEKTQEEAKDVLWTELTTMVLGTAPSPCIVLGDLNAGHEPLQSHYRCVRNYDRLVGLLHQASGVLLDHGPTWVPRARAAKGILDPVRTLDRMAICHVNDFAVRIAVDLDSRPADHGVLAAVIAFPSIPRDWGRPKPDKRHSFIDAEWAAAKRQLYVPPGSLADRNFPLQAFWTARNDIRHQARQPLRILGPSGAEVDDEDGVALVQCFFASLWGCSDPVASPPLQMPPYAAATEPPSIPEIRAAIQSLRRGAAPGKDRIRAVTLRDNLDTAAEVYASILRTVWKEGVLPSEWKDVVVRPIVKKTNPAPPQGVRPISLVSTSVKILNLVIMRRHADLYNACLHPNQHAYRAGHSTATAVQVLLQRVRQSGRHYIALVDINKAYDSVSRSSLQQALAAWDIPAFEQRLVLDQYVGSRVHVELNGCCGTPFEHCSGVRQGCPLSSLLFNLVMADVHRSMDPCITGRCAMESFADDIMLDAPSELAVKVALRHLRASLAVKGLTINDEKTRIFMFDLSIPSSLSIKWLGFHLTADLTWRAELESRLQAMVTAGEEISRILHLRRIRLAPNQILTIVDALIAVHARVPTFLEFPLDFHDTLYNELSRNLLLLVKCDVQKADLDTARLLNVPPRFAVALRYVCEFCGKSCRTAAAVGGHRSTCRANPAAPRVVCPICGKSFYARTLTTHQRACVRALPDG